jgi:hypothetical protein
MTSKNDKPAGLPPFRNALIDRFESNDTIIGVQLSVNLMNICGWQDLIFAAMFAGTSDEVGSFTSNDNRLAVSTKGSTWKQVSTTEVCLRCDKRIITCLNFDRP